jgi:hypothetical protein
VAHFVGWNFNIYLASALWIESRAVIVRVVMVVFVIVRRIGGSFGQGIRILIGCQSRFVRAGFRRLLCVFPGLWGGGRFSGTQGVYAFQKKSLSSADPAKKEPWQIAATGIFARSEWMTFL